VGSTYAGQSGVVGLQHDKHLPPVRFPSLDAVRAEYGVWSRESKHGMYNDRLGTHRMKGKFYVFDLQHAQCLIRLLCENSYVRFGDNYFHQDKGIPMGINPAVYMANYYLFAYEYMFLQQLVDLAVAHPPQLPLHQHPYVDELLHHGDSLPATAWQPFVGDIAMHLLTAFRFIVSGTLMI